ncbi:MAG: hypothetical protein Q8O23_01520 [Gallionella sp.]|nr:hypothetical protein [Gallionella sp.]
MSNCEYQSRLCSPLEPVLFVIFSKDMPMLPNFRKTSLLLLCALISFLAACSNLPDGKQARKEAEQVANNDAISPSLFKVTDLARENGWAEGENRYLIRFNYSLVSQKPYPEMLIEYLKQSEDEFKNMSDAELNAAKMQMGMGAMLTDMTEALGQSSPIGSAQTMLQKYPEIKIYLQARSSAFKDDPVIKLTAVVGVYTLLNELGLPDDAPTGHAISRTVTFTYIKTEKGWIKSS